MYKFLQKVGFFIETSSCATTPEPWVHVIRNREFFNGLKLCLLKLFIKKICICVCKFLQKISLKQVVVPLLRTLGYCHSRSGGCPILLWGAREWPDLSHKCGQCEYTGCWSGNLSIHTMTAQ